MINPTFVIIVIFNSQAKQNPNWPLMCYNLSSWVIVGFVFQLHSFLLLNAPLVIFTSTSGEVSGKCWSFDLCEWENCYLTYERLACWTYSVLSHLTTTTLCCNIVRGGTKPSTESNVCWLLGDVHAFLVLLVWLTITYIVALNIGWVYLQPFTGNLFHFSCCWYSTSVCEQGMLLKQKEKKTENRKKKLNNSI